MKNPDTKTSKHFDLRGLGWPEWLKNYWLSLDGTTVGITEPTVAQVLYALIIANKPTYGLPSMPYTIVETGIRGGTTACWLALAANAIEGYYFGFEIEPSCVISVNNIFKEQKLDDHAIAVEGSAPEAVINMFERIGEGCSIDLLFIDDDHSAKQIKKEVRMLWPLIRPGGFMAFHDVIGSFPVWEIIKPLGGMKLVHQPFNQLGQPPFGGLGILRKPVE